MSGNSQQLISATASVAKPSAPSTPATELPAASSPVTTATIATVTHAFTMLLAAMMRDRLAGSVPVCKMA